MRSVGCVLVPALLHRRAVPRAQVHAGRELHGQTAAPLSKSPALTSMNCMRNSLEYLMRSPSFLGLVSSAPEGLLA